MGIQFFTFFRFEGKEDGSFEEEQSHFPHDDEPISFAPEDIKHVEEVLYDPVDEVVVEDCCPEVCYRTCPCCIGDPDSPFWQLWYRHRLQVSRLVQISLKNSSKYI